MEEAVSTLIHRRLTRNELNALIDSAPTTPVSLSDDHRRSLSARFRAVPGTDHRRLDAWTVEQAGRAQRGFRWSPTTARRVLGSGALRRIASAPALSIGEAVSDEITDQLLRAASGYARGGSLGYWLANASVPELGLITAEALNWATQVTEIAEGLENDWRIAPSDAFYDVATARTTLRGRRDLVVASDEHRVIIRVRAGTPGKSAGPGLRSDLTIETLAHPGGLAPARFIGVWPEAGVVLSVDATMADLRRGARDLVRTAVAQQRIRALIAA
jgi:hypothetical protein